MAAKTRAGLDAPEGAADRLRLVTEYRRQAERIVQTAAVQAARSADDAIYRAFERGAIDAVAELSEALRVDTTELVGRMDTYAVARLAAEAHRTALAPARGMVQSATAGMQRITLDALSPTVAGAATRRAQAQQALDRFARAGITGFTDRAGRNWKADSYIEMAMRTQMTGARIAGHTDRLVQHGHDLIVVSDHIQECELCRPWEGKILSLSGTVVGAIQVPNVLTGGSMGITIAGTLAQAREAGLFHPNCGHSYSAFQPGVTSTSFGETADPEGDRNRQKLRKLERDVRDSKLLESAALDEPTRKAQAVKTRAISAKIKAHTEATGVTRRRNRETVGGVLGVGAAGRAAAGRPVPTLAGPALATAVGQARVVVPTAVRIGALAGPPGSKRLAVDTFPLLKAQEKPGTAAHDVTVVNPKYGDGPAYQANCSHCVTAYELRRRGYDVEAEPLPERLIAKGGRDADQVIGKWKTPDTNKPATFRHTPGGRTGVEETVAEWPEGARGWVAVRWSKAWGRGGHVFAVEKVDGKAHYSDPQRGLTDASRHFGKGKIAAGGVWVARVDDLKPTGGALSFVKEAGE